MQGLAEGNSKVLGTCNFITWKMIASMFKVKFKVSVIVKFASLGAKGA